MIAIHYNQLNDGIDEHQKVIDGHIKGLKQELTDWIKKPVIIDETVTYKLTKRQIFYLRLLRNKLGKIVLGNTIEIKRYKRLFDTLIPHSEKTRKTGFIIFKDELIKKMGYSKLRSGATALYPIFYANLGIKACSYCNSQLTVSVDSKGGKKSAKFQVDHYHSKSKYPCFSISFFNLYPVCASCNLKKGNKKLDFDLFSEEQQLLKKSEFIFKIEQKSLALFRVTQNINDLVIDFDGKNKKQFNEAFDIQGIYDSQKDLAAEIITKALVYNDSYKKSLSNAISNLYKANTINFNRFITGNYTDPKDIHKRPMSKFTQDISRQLGLID